MFPQQFDGGQGFEGGHVAAARHDDIRRAALIVAGPRPDADASGAMLDGGIHIEPLRRGLFSGHDHVHVVAAAQAVSRHGNALDTPNFAHALIERRGHELVHLGRVVAIDEIRRVTVAAKERFQFTPSAASVADARSGIFAVASFERGGSSLDVFVGVQSDYPPTIIPTHQKARPNRCAN